jgi:hypothetical protein
VKTFSAIGSRPSIDAAYSCARIRIGFMHLPALAEPEDRAREVAATPSSQGRHLGQVRAGDRQDDLPLPREVDQRLRRLTFRRPQPIGCPQLLREADPVQLVEVEDRDVVRRLLARDPDLDLERLGVVEGEGQNAAVELQP